MLSTDRLNLPKSLPAEDHRLLNHLFRNSPLIENALAESGRPIKPNFVTGINVFTHSNNGRNRQVFRVNVELHDGTNENIALKLARRVDTTCFDHAVMSYYANLKLGKAPGSIYQLEDGRVISVGKFHPGEDGDITFQIFPTATMHAIIKESLSVWQGLDGFFIPEPKGDQFLIVRQQSSLQASLIDKGDFFKKVLLPYTLHRCPNTQQVTIHSHVGDLIDFSNWLIPMDASEVVTRVINQLAIDKYISVTSDPDNEMLAGVGLFDGKQPIETRGVVLGVIDALGEQDGTEFIKTYSCLIRQGRERLDDQEAEQIADQFLHDLDALARG